MLRLSTRDHGNVRGSPDARASGEYESRSGILGMEDRTVRFDGSYTSS